MPTGYDKKRGTAKSKKKWNVDSIALSLTNTAVKYGTVYSHPFFSNLLSFWYYTWIFFCKVNITWLKVVDFMITKAVFLYRNVTEKSITRLF